ncbi:MAG: hypothetical protein ACRETO_07365 [Gammaproteobacteria bacterium]
MKPVNPMGGVHAARILLSGMLVAVLAGYISGAEADSLSDLRTVLQGLDASTEIKGTLDVQSIKLNPKQDDKQKDTKQTPPAQLQLAIDAGEGLGIHLSPALLQRIDAEQQAKAENPEQPTPTADLLGEVGPMEIERIVSVAPGLSRALDGAEAVASKQTELDGAQVQELSMKLPFKASKEERSNISDYRGGMTIWLDAKGVPLAYQQTFHGKFCKFFLCVTVDETRDGKLQIVAGRLIATSYIDESKQSGLGQDGDSKRIYNLDLENTSDARQNK